MNTPILHPPNYAIYYILYLVSSNSNIFMVLLQEDDDISEHVIYYLSKSLSGLELWYLHVEKLSLVAVIVFHIFFHYILLRTTTFTTKSNPIYHILNHRVLLDLDQVLENLGHVWPFLGLRQAGRKQSARRSGDRGILPPFYGFLSLGFYVMGMGCHPMGLPMFRPHLQFINRYLGNVRK